MVKFDGDLKPHPGWLKDIIETVVGGYGIVALPDDWMIVESQKGPNPNLVKREDGSRYWRTHPNRLIGGCMAIIRPVWDMLGGFDTNMKVMEDYDFCERAVKEGVKIAFTGRGCFVHFGDRKVDHRAAKESALRLAEKIYGCVGNSTNVGEVSADGEYRGQGDKAQSREVGRDNSVVSGMDDGGREGFGGGTAE